MFLLLDQNVPRAALIRLRTRFPEHEFEHCSLIGLAGADDSEVVAWARERSAITATFDEDLADQRLFPVGSHSGVIRIRIEPTDEVAAFGAIERVLTTLAPESIMGNLIIVDLNRIRIVRPSKPG